MQHNFDSHGKRHGVFLRMVEEDTLERVSVASLTQWANHYGMKQTEYIHRALKEKMERDLRATRKAMSADKGKPADIAVADRWFTPEEAEKVREFAKQTMEVRPFQSTDSIVNRFGLNF